MRSWRETLTSPLGAALLPISLIGGLMIGCVGLCVGFPCFPTGIRYGLWIGECPTGELRLAGEVEAQGLVRGDTGTIAVRPYARFVQSRSASAWIRSETLYRGVRIDLSLRDADGEEAGPITVERWKWSGDQRAFPATLPDVPDGDYILRATLRAPFETVEIDVPLPLYTPAVVHLATDRPLYRPGDEVRLRTVLLRRTDLGPLDGRPGRWRIRAPDGTEMLVEDDRAGAFGVVDTSFPVDTSAPVGTWTARFESGDDHDEVAFEVRPFSLPRFTVDLEPSATWYATGDRVRVDGVARYTSGAPVAGAPVRIAVRAASGRWPPPVAWEEPFLLETDREGRFRLELDEVPSDLVDLARLSVTARVTEAAGETAIGAAALVLSQRDLLVDAVTELGDGVVGGFNNRVYLRVTRPDGSPLREAALQVRNAWDPEGAARETTTDVDGVASLQLDPGDPSTVVDPPAPVRVRPVQVEPPALQSGQELGADRSLTLPERRALDAALPAIAACGDLVVGGGTVSIGARIAPSGAVTDLVTGASLVEGCVADALRGVRFDGGEVRTLQLAFRVPDSGRPRLDPRVGVAAGPDPGVAAALSDPSLRARRCLERGQGLDGADLLRLHWRATEGSAALEVAAEPRPGSGLSEAARACVARALGGLRLAKPAPADALGTVRVALRVPAGATVAPAKPTTRTGYELLVRAGDREGRLVLPVGHIPDLRLRATPSLASGGDEVVIEALRGPGHRGELPEELVLWEGSRRVAEAERPQDDNAWTFRIPEEVDGFLHATVGGVRAVVYVAPRDRLQVTLATDAPTYRPGQTAKLTVQTTAGGRGVPAGVGLMGVDSTLAQLAPLLPPDDAGRVTVRATAERPAFGAFDPRALALGQVRGESAALAAVLRITTLPMDAAGDARVWASQATVPDDEEALSRGFYRALERLLGAVRAWEASAAEGEQMTPERMARMWEEALETCRREGEPAVDAFGRTLDLEVLPADLLEQLDPRRVVADGTRLPEDVIGWTAWVEKEVGR